MLKEGSAVISSIGKCSCGQTKVTLSLPETLDHYKHGGAKQLDKVLVNQLDVVLDELSDAMWA
jgi:hypothetical protein